MPKTSPDSSQTSTQTSTFEEMFGSDKAAPQAAMTPFENEEKRMGRLRKYEQIGIYGDLSVREVVRFRFTNNRYPLGVSDEMRDEYNYWYFSRPNRKKDGTQYAKHLRAWERREKWIDGLQEIGSTRNTPVTDLQAERKRRGR
jgi:hypothetical protein